MGARDRLIVGLDVPTVKEAETIVATLGDDILFYKIGHQLAFAGGLELARDLASSGKKIFLDMKLLDIDNTVASGVENIAKMGMSMLTLHAYPKAMRAAVAAAKGSDLCLLGVTVLTSMDDEDLKEAGYGTDAVSLVLRRAGQARAAGMGGIVCSAEEATAVRNVIGPDMALVTPGIRPAGCRKGRPEARDDAVRCHSRRIEPPRRGPSDRQGARSESGCAGYSERDAVGALAGQPLSLSKTRQRSETWPRDTGSRASMSAIPNATRITSPRQSRPSKNTAPISWRVAARSPSSRVRRVARNVIIEFPSLQHAVDCYNSPEYQIAAKIRQQIADAEMVVVEGI